jgi:hypothetical protein
VAFVASAIASQLSTSVLSQSKITARGKEVRIVSSFTVRSDPIVRKIIPFGKQIRITAN